MRYLLQINKTQIMRFYLLTINLLLIWGFAQGQDLRLLDGLGHGGIGVRFLTEVKSIGNYNVADKHYYVDYLDNSDTSKISKYASFLQKALTIQRATRTFNRNMADFIVNISFSTEREGGTIYRELKYHSFNGPKTKEEWDIYSADANRSSRTNPGNPYYKSSLGEAGSGKRIDYQRISAPSYSFSTIIDGYSPTGDLLWSTIVTDYRSAAVTNSIFSYLCFAAVGKLGVTTEESVQYISNNPFYEQINDGQLTGENTVLYPSYSSSSKKVDVIAIIKSKEKTTFVLRYAMNQKFFRKTRAILKNGDIIINSSDYYAEQWLANNSFKSFLFIDFPANSNDYKDFSLVFFNKNNDKERLSIRLL